MAKKIRVNNNFSSEKDIEQLLVESIRNGNLY